ncbi:MAG: GFA family protein [Acetobacteraceae bacterium]
MTTTGGCQCGAVRYAVSAAPAQTYVCHCRECQRQSSSAFGISVIFPADAFAVTQGEVRAWRRPADSGRVVDCMFCPACGSRLWHATPGEGLVSVKGGSLDQPPDLTGAMHIWTSRRLAGVVIPDGVTQFAQEPD